MLFFDIHIVIIVSLVSAQLDSARNLHSSAWLKPENSSSNSSQLAIFLHTEYSCPRPYLGCNASSDKYTNVDCDGDGVLDHVCEGGDKIRGILSGYGCPNEWTQWEGKGQCLALFGGNLHYDNKFTKNIRFTDI